MANKLNGFLDNFFSGLTNPGGSLKDFQHASRLYVNDAFRLAPKVKFLYFVNFTLTPQALELFPLLDQRHRSEINMLVKTVDLPQYRATVETKNQYNRKKNIQTSIEYDPVSLTMHDDNVGLTTMLLEAYYKYYFRDGSLTDAASSYGARSTYRNSDTRSFRFGLDNDKTVPFFKDIKLYQFSRQEFTEYILVNPLISDWGHDRMDQSDSAGMNENSLTVRYESVFYNRGAVGEDVPASFATRHYDTTPSPLDIQGGGTSSVFGAGGILDGASATIGDIASGEADLGTLIGAANTIRNAGDLSFDTLRNEGLNVLKNAVRNVGSQQQGGIPGTEFPKYNGTGGNQNNVQASPSSVDNPLLRAGKIAAARIANGLD